MQSSPTLFHSYLNMFVYQSSKLVSRLQVQIYFKHQTSHINDSYSWQNFNIVPNLAHHIYTPLLLYVCYFQDLAPPPARSETSFFLFLSSPFAQPMTHAGFVRPRGGVHTQCEKSLQGHIQSHSETASRQQAWGSC